MKAPLNQILSNRFAIALTLFLIGSLHTMLFGIFELPENFLMGQQSKNLEIFCKILFYLIAIGVAVSHQWIVRKFGLRTTLYGGLIFNILGTFFLLVSQWIGGSTALILLNIVLFGVSLTSVINSLVTYVILEFPEKVGFGIVALFAFLNLGIMLASLVLDIFHGLHIDHFVYPFIISLLFLSIWFVHKYFFDMRFPAHMSHMKKGSVMWKEMHYRLALYVIAIIAYGLTETTFYLWGYNHIEQFQGMGVANEIISFFWLFMIIGQVLLLLPLYFFPQVRIFYTLIIICIGAAFYFPLQSKVPQLLVGLMAAGFGCSAVFPILLSMMERELLSIAQGIRVLPFIEASTSLMIAGYFVGVGIIDLWILYTGEGLIHPLTSYFHLGAVFIATTGLIAVFLNLTASEINN